MSVLQSAARNASDDLRDGTPKVPARHELQVRECSGDHRFFVAATVGVESEGKAVIICVCTSCGASFSEEFKVSGGNSPLEVHEKN